MKSSVKCYTKGRNLIFWYKMENNSSLSKYIAQAGICARRKAVDLIKEGQVTVNAVTIYEPGYKLTLADQVFVRGQMIVAAPEKVYIVMNKPKDYITTLSDEANRKTVMQLLKNSISERIYPIGRLDRTTTGVLLFTNDGQLAQELAHPKYEIQKSYFVTLNRSLSFADFALIQKGIELYDGFVKVDFIEYVGKKSELIVDIHSGKNRIIRRIFESLEYEVTKLDRISFAGITKKGLLSGSWRFLNSHEISLLKNSHKK